MGRSSLAALVDAFEKRGEEPAYVFRRGYRSVRWSYAEVARLARRFAAELRARGIQRGDRVVLWGDNRAEWVAAFFGCAVRGVVVVPLDRGSTAEFVHRIVTQVGAVLAVCSRDVCKSMEAVPVIPLDELSEVVGQHQPDGEAPSIAREDILQIIFTSGTTAEPKGVVITHGNVLANLEPLEREIAKYLKYERLVHPLRFLNLLPLSHVFGQFLAMFVPQALGATVVFADSLNPADIIATIRRERVSVCVAVPQMLASLRNHLEREYDNGGRLDGFRRQLRESEGKHFARRWWRFRKLHHEFGWKFWAFISGGSALDAELERFWNRLAFAVIQGYGLTETTSLVSVNHPFKSSKQSIGRLLPGREVKLAEDGEILVRGENVASRYLQGQAMTKVAGDQGWFATGDLGAFDASGNLQFKGRKKNVIVTPAGMNVHPEDLEQALRQQTGVRDAVVVAVPVGGNAEPCPVLLLDPGFVASEILHAANQQLAEFQRMTRSMVWPEQDFPRTATHKPQMAVIELYVSSHQGQRAGGGIEDVLAQLASTGKAAGRSSAELNLTSMEKVELMAALESRYQVDLNEVAFEEASTVVDLQRIISETERNIPKYVYPRWPRRWPFRAIRWLSYWLIAYPATMLLAKPRIHGRENLEGIRGPLLIACNHTTMADIGFVLAALPPAMRTKIAPAMQGEMLESMRTPDATLPWWRRQLHRLEYLLLTAFFNVFPLPQRSGFLKSFSFAGEIVDHGYSVLVFPEGRRTQDGRLSPFQAGIGILANRLDVPLVPVRIDGLFEAAREERHWVRPNRIVVRVGKPVRYGESENPASIASDLERRVREL